MNRKNSISRNLRFALLMSILVTLLASASITLLTSYKKLEDTRLMQKGHSVAILTRVFKPKFELYNLAEVNDILQRELLPNGFAGLELVNGTGDSLGFVGIKPHANPDFVQHLTHDTGEVYGTLKAWNGQDDVLHEIWGGILQAKIVETVITIVLLAILLNYFIKRNILRPLILLRDHVVGRDEKTDMLAPDPSIQSRSELAEIADVYDQSWNQLVEACKQRRRSLNELREVNIQQLFQNEILEQTLKKALMAVAYHYQNNHQLVRFVGVELPVQIRDALKQSHTDLKQIAFDLGGNGLDVEFKNTMLSDGAENTRSILVRTPDDDRLWSIRVLDILDIGSAALVTDLTVIKRNEKIQTQQSKMASLGVLSSGIAHDLNNVLAILSSSIESNVVSLTPSAAVASERAIERGKSLVKQLLTFSHDKKLALDSIKIPQLVEELEAVLPASLGPNIQVTMQCHTNLNVLGNRDFIQLALINLTTNARDSILDKKYSGEISIVFREAIALDVMLSGAAESKQHMAIDVIDDGNGVPEEIRDHIFEPFFTTKQLGEGTGLGLSTVYSFLRNAGGGVFYQNVAGGGAKFTMVLAATEIENHVPVNREKMSESLQGKTILFIDDEDALCTLCGVFLTQYGAKVITINSLEEAMRYLKSEKSQHIDALVSDLHLADGVADPIFLYARDHFRSIPCILISGNSSQSNLLNIQPRGNIQLLEKPFRMAELKNRLTIGLKLSSEFLAVE